MSVESEALAIVEEALEIEEPQARAAFVAARCGDRADLLARVMRILAAEDSASPLLKTDSFAAALGLTGAPPERIGPFRVTGEIARGGMGMVVRAERDDGMFQQTVAIKLIRGDIASERARARFAEERRILGRLRHPGIVRILDGGEVEGQPWLAMDHIDGRPITQALDAAEAGRATRLDTFEAVCEAVAHAHRELVIHADIKPGNILLGRDGTVHLLDFGIARLIVELSEEGAGDSYPLTKGYAAPERTVGTPPSVASDVFSLGMLLFEMLTGNPPSIDGPFVPGTMLPLASALTGDCGAIAARATAVDPADRYPDVVSLLADVRRHRAHVPVAARRDAGWRYHAGRFVLRHRKGLAATAFLGALLLAVTAFSTWSYYRAEVARREADARFADARGAARYLLFDLMPKLEKLPRSLPLRTEAANAAQRYLQRLSQARQSTDAVRIEAATGLLRLAQYQAEPGRPNLAQPIPADANLRQAEALLAGVPRASAAPLLARVRLSRVKLAVWMQADERGADRLLREAQRTFAEADVRDPGLQAEIAIVAADLKGWQGRFDEEVALAEQALRRLGPDASLNGQLIRTRLTELVAEGTYYAGRPVDSLVPYGAMLAGLEAMHKRWPEDNYVFSRLSIAQWNYGTLLLDLKRFAEGEAMLAKAEESARQVAAFDPADLEAVRSLRVARNARAQALGFLGRTDAALALLAGVRGEDEAAFARDPSPRRARDVVFDNTLIGELLDHAGRSEEACRADRKTLALYDDLGRRGLATGLDSANNLKLLKARIAKNCE